MLEVLLALYNNQNICIDEVELELITTSRFA